MPLSVPAIATLSTFAFLYAWNSFVWPLVVINSGNLDNRVLALSLQLLGGRAADTPNLILAGVVIALLPPITVFILAQRYFVENVASTGLKGCGRGRGAVPHRSVRQRGGGPRLRR